MRTQKIIEQFGYKPNEAKVYLSALTLGECTISDLAHSTNLPRTSVQVIVEKLHADGLMNFYTKKRYKYWTAEKPEKFLIHLKEKEVALEAILSKLNALQHVTEKRPSINILNGVEEIKLIFQDILETKQNIRAMIPWGMWIKILGEEYIHDFIELRVKHFLKMRLLTPKTKETIKLKQYDAHELRYICFLPQQCTITDAVLVYGNKVVLVSLNEKYPTGILIDDAGMSHTMTVLFDEIWDKNTE
jgi:sugar-specific transcriptional regulator TrmB